MQTSVVEIWTRSKSDLFAQFIMQGFLQKVPLLALLRFRNLNDSRHFRSSSKGEHNLLSQKLNCKTWLIFPYLYRHFYLLEINFLWFSGLTAKTVYFSDALYQPKWFWGKLIATVTHGPHIYVKTKAKNVNLRHK